MSRLLPPARSRSGARAQGGAPAPRRRLLLAVAACLSAFAAAPAAAAGADRVAGLRGPDPLAAADAKAGARPSSAPRIAVRPAPVARTAAKPTAAERRLGALVAEGLLPPDLAALHTGLLRTARTAARRLGARERAALDGARAIAERLAATGGLTADRVAPVFQNLAATYDWFVTQARSAPATGTRTTFGTSPVVYSFRADAGWQIHPLGNWGQINSLMRAGAAKQARGRIHADAMLALAARRAGRLRFEYYFWYLGGGPGWVSGMANATALPPLARLWVTTGDDRYRVALGEALAVLETPAPEGALIPGAPGMASFALYSQQPQFRVGNAIAQVLVALSETLPLLPPGLEAERVRSLLAQGLADARQTMPAFDTGSWSYYGTGTYRSLSDSHYHGFFTELLNKLCTYHPTPDLPFCVLVERFASYPLLDPALRGLAVRATKSSVIVRVRSGAEASATVRLLRGGTLVRSVSVRLRRGVNRVTLSRRLLRRRYVVTVDATNMAATASSRVQGTTPRL